MAKNFVEFWKPLFDHVAAKYSNPPQGFGEIGTYDCDDVCLGTTYYDIVNKRRVEQEFADIWYTYLKGAERLDVTTTNIWIFPLGECKGNPDPISGDLLVGCKQNENPAYRIVKAIVDEE